MIHSWFKNGGLIPHASYKGGNPAAGGGQQSTCRVDSGTRFVAVRSAVREAALTALVVLCTNLDRWPATQQRQQQSGGGGLVEEMVVMRLVSCLEEVIAQEHNAVAVGLAMDAFNRLVATTSYDSCRARVESTVLRARLYHALESCPIECKDVLMRADSCI